MLKNAGWRAGPNSPQIRAGLEIPSPNCGGLEAGSARLNLGLVGPARLKRAGPKSRLYYRGRQVALK